VLVNLYLILTTVAAATTAQIKDSGHFVTGILRLVNLYLINGERVRSLLCSREALGKPTGAAAIP